MPLTIGSNIAALKVQRSLNQIDGGLASVFQRLSSGQRINRASDDAAGLAVATGLNTSSRVYSQGVRNFNDGISLLQIADGSLEQLGTVLVRLQELATQAANGSLSYSQRKALDDEGQSLSDEFARIAQSTQFNDRYLFSSAFGNLRLQGGFGTDGGIGSGLGGIVGTGEFESRIDIGSTGLTPDESVVADVNNDGNQDLIRAGSGSGDRVEVLLGQGDGTFGSALTVFEGGIGTINQIDVGDFNGDGIIDVAIAGSDLVVVSGVGDGSFGGAITLSTSTTYAIAVGDINNDGIDDIVAEAGENIESFVSNSSGSFSSAGSFFAGNPLGGISGIGLADLNGDDQLDIVTSVVGASGILSIMNGDGTGSFSLSQTIAFETATQGDRLRFGDFDEDGQIDIAALGYGGPVAIYRNDGQGSFSLLTTFTSLNNPSSHHVADFNGDGFLDLAVIDHPGGFFDRLNVFLNDGSGSFTGSIAISVGPGVLDGGAFGDFNNDGVVDLAGVGTDGVYLGSTTTGVAPLSEFDLRSKRGALEALTYFEQAHDRITAQRGEIGAFQSRLASALNTLSGAVENFRSAEARIVDADIAQETAELVRLNILQQGATAVLAQANSTPALALALLE